jgi:hypothetical protein
MIVQLLLESACVVPKRASNRWVAENMPSAEVQRGNRSAQIEKKIID